MYRGNAASQVCALPPFYGVVPGAGQSVTPSG
jgi:hypothetical protein